MRHFRHLGIAALVCAAALSAAAQAPGSLLQQIQDEYVRLHDQLRPSVVNIDVQGKSEEPDMGSMEDLYRFFNLPMPTPDQQRRMPSRPRGTGSGFIYDAAGYIITNNHVVENADKITVRLANGKEYEATVAGNDPETDIAVVKIEPDEPLQPLVLGDSDKVKVGEFAIAIGSPRNLEGSVSFGHVSALGRENLRDLAMQGLTFQNLIQTDAAINLGNSGGPLCNIRGEVIGINTAIVFGANSIGFAIPINTAKATVPMLISDGRVSRGYLGVSIDDAKNYDGVDTLGLPDMDGAVVRQVQPDTPAAKADLKTYDVIRKVNGEPVKTASELVRKISSFTPGTTVTLEVWRDKAQVNIEITLTERNVRENMRAAEKSVLGIRVQELAPQMLERMGMDKDLKGVVVINVDPGSPAEDARLMQGDIIIEVAQQPVTSPAEFFTTVEKHAEPGKSLLVRYVRGNNDPDITVIRVPKN
ncbi:MAG: trypsin-like peptidase domain-containing protein [Candidatus Hydrogenedentes bacterium]|nr:trypsin-like peptidase domain-containing protein [Candidatus Hydrogenedentota bacterium]